MSTAFLHLVVAMTISATTEAEEDVPMAEMTRSRVTLELPENDDLSEPSLSTPKAPEWPWGAQEPSWADAQANIDLYMAYLEFQNPNFEIKQITNGLVTAYTPGPESCGEFADGFTATMQDAALPGLAVARQHLRRYRKLGIHVHVPSYGTYLPDDTGGAMNRSAENGIFHVDIRFQSVQVALNWGRKPGVLFLLTPKETK